jgi:hypothetical protein
VKTSGGFFLKNMLSSRHKGAGGYFQLPLNFFKYHENICLILGAIWSSSLDTSTEPKDYLAQKLEGGRIVVVFSNVFKTTITGK